MSKLLAKIRGNVIAGVLLLLPLVTTAYVFFKFFLIVDKALPELLHNLPAIGGVFPEKWPFGLGIILTLLVAYFAGLAAKNVLGGLIIQAGNGIISGIPILNKVYLGIQQILDAIVSGNRKMFERPVLIQYPKEHSYCIAFVTGDTSGEIPQRVGGEMVSVFLPTTPNPTSGFLLFLPKSEVIELDMTVETAIKLIMSAGMVSADKIKETQHLYTLPSSLKGFNWLRSLRLRRKGRSNSEPTDLTPPAPPMGGE